MLKQFQSLYLRYKSMSAWVTKLKSDQDSNNNTAKGKNIFDVLKAASRSLLLYMYSVFTCKYTYKRNAANYKIDYI